MRARNGAAGRQPAEAARLAGLRYVSDQAPGLRRQRHGRGFTYLRPDGSPLHDAEELARIRRLAIPPAWTRVWICPSPLGHIQATGRDARGRKQYRYHPRWREARDETKYSRLLEFARALPKIRERVQRDLDRRGLPRQKVLATVVRLLEATLIRVGNEEYTRHNRSFGLTTLRDHHVDVKGTQIRFRFRGKSGKEHEIGLRDPQLSRLLRRLQELPGQELFQYQGEGGQACSVRSEDVNAYLREVTGEDFTAKDFRTWAGTVRAAWELRACPEVHGARGAQVQVKRALEAVARRLGNTVAICRKSYVHPLVVEAYLEGRLHRELGRRRMVRPGLRPHEAAVMALLEAQTASGDEKLRSQLTRSLRAVARKAS